MHGENVIEPRRVVLYVAAGHGSLFEEKKRRALQDGLANVFGAWSVGQHPALDRVRFRNELAEVGRSQGCIQRLNDIVVWRHKDVIAKQHVCMCIVHEHDIRCAAECI